MRRSTQEPEQLDRLCTVPFVRKLRYVPAPRDADTGSDGELHVDTPSGSFRFLLQVKRSYLVEAALHSVVSRAELDRRERQLNTMLLARHISRATAKRLIEHHVGFADTAGNVHIRLDGFYNWTVIGQPEARTNPAERATTAT